MWLSGLHIPESYLTALLQAACRKNGWALDCCTLYTEVSSCRSEEEVTDRPTQGDEINIIVCSIWWVFLKTSLAAVGCYVSGMYLEGADWDMEKGCLVRSKPKVPVVELPFLKIIPIEAHRLRPQVQTTITADFITRSQFMVWMFLPDCQVFSYVLYPREHWGHPSTPPQWEGMRWVLGWCSKQTWGLPYTTPTGSCRECVYISTRRCI